MITTEQIEQALTRSGGKVQAIAKHGRVEEKILLDLLLKQVRVTDPKSFSFRYIGTGKSNSEVLLIVEIPGGLRVIKCGPIAEIKREQQHFDTSVRPPALALRMSSRFRPIEFTISEPDDISGEYVAVSSSVVGDCDRVETLRSALEDPKYKLDPIISSFLELGSELARWQQASTKRITSPDLPFGRFPWFAESKQNILAALNVHSQRCDATKLAELAELVTNPQSPQHWFNQLRNVKSNRVGICHGDLNSQNLLLGIAPRSEVEAFVIDFAWASEGEYSPALDWAKLERDVRLRGLKDAAGSDSAAFAKYLETLDSSLRSSKDLLNGDDTHAGKCMGLISVIRNQYSVHFSGVTAPTYWIEYLYYLLCWTLAYLNTDEFQDLSTNNDTIAVNAIIDSAIDTFIALDEEIDKFGMPRSAPELENIISPSQSVSDVVQSPTPQVFLDDPRNEDLKKSPRNLFRIGVHKFLAAFSIKHKPRLFIILALTCTIGLIGLILPISSVLKRLLYSDAGNNVPLLTELLSSRLPQQPRTIIYLADIEGTGDSLYNISSALKAELDKLVERHPDMDVVSLGRAVTEKEDKSPLLKELADKHATLLVWGWYGKTAEKAHVRLHFEPIAFPQAFETKQVSVTVPLRLLEQLKLSLDILPKHVNDISLLCEGMVNLMNNNYKAAATSFQSALAHGATATSIINKNYLLLLLLIAEINQGNLHKAHVLINNAVAHLEQPTDTPSIALLAVKVMLSVEDHDISAVDHLCHSILLTRLNHPALDPELGYWLAYSCAFSYGHLDASQEIDRFQERALSFIAHLPRITDRDYFSLGMAYTSLCDPNSALESYLKADQLRHDSPDTLTQIGNLLAARGEVDNAKVYFERAETVNPAYVPAFYADAAISLQFHDLVEALSIYRKAEKANPNWSDLNVQEANVLFELGNKESAFETLEHILRVDPTNPRLYQARAALHYRNQQPEMARSDYETALGLDSSHFYNSLIYEHLGDVLMQLGKMKDARAAFDRAVSLSPFDPTSSLVSRGEFYLAMHKPANAIANFDIAMRLFDKRQSGRSCLNTFYSPFLHASALVSRGKALLQNNMWSRALHDFDLAIRIANLSSAHYQKSLILEKQRSYLEAIKAINRAIESEANPDYHVAKGRFLFEANSIEESIEAYASALKISPNLEMALVGQADAYQQKGDWDKAEHNYALLLRSNPRDISYLMSHAWTLHKLKQSAKSLDVVNAALAVEPDNAPLLHLRAIIRSDNGHFDEALADYVHAIKISPTTAVYRFNEARLFGNVGMYSKAANCYRETVKLDAKNALAWEELADIEALHLKDYERAVHDYSTALKLREDGAAYFGRAQAYREKNDLKNALKDISRSIMLSKDSDNNRFRMGLSIRISLNRRLGNWRGVLKDIDTVMSLNDRSSAVYTTKALAFLHIGDLQNAASDAETAVKLDPRFANAYEIRGDVQCQQAKAPTAVDSYKMAIKYLGRSATDLDSDEPIQHSKKLVSLTHKMELASKNECQTSSRASALASK